MTRATIGVRFVALLVDGVILGFVHLALLVLVGDGSFFVGVLVDIAYYAYFESAPRGQTPGKQVMGVRVVDNGTGEPLDLSKAAMRAMVRVVSFAACFIGFVWALLNDENQTWHDVAADSAVVRSL